MKPITKILVPIDRDDEHRSAPERAARLASHCGASVTLAGVVAEIPWYARMALGDPEAVERALLSEERDRLEQVAGPIRARGVSVGVRALRGRPTLEIVREAIRGEHDLLIKDAGSCAGGSFRSTDTQILRTCPSPVWLSQPCPTGPGRGRERMLALIDPAPLGTSPASPEERESVGASIMDMAVMLAEAMGFELIVAHVWDATAQGLLRNCGYTDDQIHAYVESVRQGMIRSVDRLLAPHRDRLAPDAFRLLRGIPSEVIPRFVADEGIDLIVMGTMARSGIAGMLIGNTAETIMGHVSCSVLAVKPEGFVSPVTLDEEPATNPDG